MRRTFTALAIAAMALAVMCGAAWAAYQEHFTLSELTSDHKAHYGPESRTRFGGFVLHGLRLSSGSTTPDYGPDDSITITPKGSAFIVYVSSADYVGNYLGLDIRFIDVSPADVISTQTATAAITHKLVNYTIDGIDVPLLVNANGEAAGLGWLADTDSQGALMGAAYSITIGGQTETGNLRSLLSTEQQLARAVVPYVEFKTDASGKVQSVTWRGVKASDPSTAVAYTNSTDENMGIFSHATSFSTLKPSARLNDGREVSLIGTGTPISSEGKIEWTVTPDVEFKVQEIAYVQIDNDSDYQWVFYPKQNVTPSQYNANVRGGTSQTYGGSGSKTIEIGGDNFSKFLRVVMGGAVLAPRHYKARSGSTIIELDEAYLKTLSNGTHNVSIEFTDGTAEIKLTKTDGNNNTGGGSGGGCELGFGLTSLAALACVVIRMRSK